MEFLVRMVGATSPDVFLWCGKVWGEGVHFFAILLCKFNGNVRDVSLFDVVEVGSVGRI